MPVKLTEASSIMVLEYQELHLRLRAVTSSYEQLDLAALEQLRAIIEESAFSIGLYNLTLRSFFPYL